MKQALQKATSGPTISSRVLVGLDSFMAAKGLDCAELSSQAGLDLTAAADPEALISLKAFVRLLENAARQCNDDAFGLELSCERPFCPLRLYDYIISNAPNLRDALKARVRFISLAISAFDVSFEEFGCDGCYTWNFPAEHKRAGQFIDLVVVKLVKNIRTQVDPFWIPSHVDIAHAEPKNLIAFTRFFGPDISFNAASTRIFFDQASLDRPLLEPDPALFAAVTEAGRKILGFRTDRPGIVLRTSDFISRSLPLRLATEAEAARVFGMAVRTFQRELEDAGTTFRELLDEVRLASARQLLTGTDMPLTEVAFRLGYSELSAFTRAARKWFGEAPSALRKRNANAVSH